MVRKSKVSDNLIAILQQFASQYAKETNGTTAIIDVCGDTLLIVQLDQDDGELKLHQFTLEQSSEWLAELNRRDGNDAGLVDNVLETWPTPEAV